MARRAFEGIALRPAADVRDGADAVRAARRIVAALSLPAQVQPIAPRARTVLLTFARAPSTVAAWELAHRLRARDDVRFAEPSFALPAQGPYRPRAAGAAIDLPGTEDCDWALRMTRVLDAWASSASRGAGVRIAHPDTGVTPHPELAATSFDVAAGHDFVDGDADVRDPLVGANPGHGTATASVLASDANLEAAPHVAGVAPAATLVPLRVSTSVVHLSWLRLVAALYRAIDAGAHVASMSLGGPLPSFALHEAVRDATDAGIVLVGAAGNGWPFVVWPAHFDETIAVAACNVERQRWALSASGPQVDLAAPGESVWRARSRRGPRFDVARSSGTSYATAHVAGACALWLAHHGRDRLVARYGTSGLPAAFAALLRERGVATSPAWPEDVMGAGLLDVAALLAAPLPARAAAQARTSSPDPIDVATLASLFPRADAHAVRRWLARTFAGGDARLDALVARIGDEIAFHLVTDPRVYVATHAALAGRRGAAAPGARVAFARASPTLAKALR